MVRTAATDDARTRRRSTELGIKVYGDSLPLMQEAAEAIRGIVASVKGAEDVSVGVSAGAMQLDSISTARQSPGAEWRGPHTVDHGAPGSAREADSA